MTLDAATITLIGGMIVTIIGVSKRQFQKTPFSRAQFAEAPALFVKPRILGIVRVAFRTLRLPGIHCWRVGAAKIVYSVSDRLKMGWIDARRYAAEVIQFEAMRHWANERFICPAMRANVLVGGKCECSVSNVVMCRRPDPTLRAKDWMDRAVLVDFRPETFFCGPPKTPATLRAKAPKKHHRTASFRTEGDATVFALFDYRVHA